MTSKLVYEIESPDRNNVIATYRLPKQFFHWLRKAGIRSSFKHHSKRYMAKMDSFIGHGRYWRINCYGLFEVSTKVADFDRWANSNPGVSIDVRLIKNEKDMFHYVNYLLQNVTELDLEFRDRFK